MKADNWLAELYSKERRSLFLTAWNVLRHVESSEDAVHAAFVKMAKRLDPPTDARLYAFKAVRNAAIDIARSKAGRPPHESLETDSVHGKAENTETQECLETGLAGLRLDIREIVELHIHSGLTFREIAELTDTPLQTIASRYRRALVTLRSFIQVEQNE